MISVMHTIDNEQRNGVRERSQVFKWVTASLLYYFTDRFYAATSMRYDCFAPIKCCYAFEKENLVILNLPRPLSFSFIPGQYAYLKVGAIDSTWHPFSISSDPKDDHIQFIIEVYDDCSTIKDTWTKSLMKSILRLSTEKADIEGIGVDFEIMGPYGGSIGNVSTYTNVLAVASGTGIVPIISLLEQNSNYMVTLNHKEHLHHMKREKNQALCHLQQTKDNGKTLYDYYFPKRLNQVYVPRDAETDDSRDDLKTMDLAAKYIQSFYTLYKIRKSYATNSPCLAVRRAILEEKRLIQEYCISAVLSLLPIWGVVMIATTVSFHAHIVEDMTNSMADFLAIGTFFGIFAFAFQTIVFVPLLEYGAYLDMVMVGVSLVSSVLYTIWGTWGNFSTFNVVLYSFMGTYMTLRTWYFSVALDSYNSTISKYLRDRRIVSLNSFRVIWIIRSIDIMTQVAPILESLQTSIHDAWGKQSRSVQSVDIYVTGDHIQAQLDRLPIYNNVHVHSGRPDLYNVMESHVKQVISQELDLGSSSLVTFCGSPHLGNIVSKNVDEVALITKLLGNGTHTLTFRQENYGLATPSIKKDKYLIPLESKVKENIIVLDEKSIEIYYGV